jgi:hypothetical protein
LASLPEVRTISLPASRQPGAQAPGNIGVRPVTPIQLGFDDAVKFDQPRILFGAERHHVQQLEAFAMSGMKCQTIEASSRIEFCLIARLDDRFVSQND